jgi:hypothetical protein
MIYLQHIVDADDNDGGEIKHGMQNRPKHLTAAGQSCESRACCASVDGWLSEPEG